MSLESTKPRWPFFGLAKSLFNNGLDGALGDVLGVFLLRGFGACLAFLLSVTVARQLGVNEVGNYFLAFSIAAIGAVAGRVGLDNTMLKLVSLYHSKGCHADVQRVYTLGLRVSVAVSLLLSVFGYLTSEWIARFVFDSKTLAGPLAFMSLSITPIVVFTLVAEALKGRRRVYYATILQSVLVPLVALLGVLWVAPSQAKVASMAYLIATVGASFIALIAWEHNRQPAIHNPTVKFAEILQSCIPLYGIAFISTALIPWAPIVALGVFGDEQQVGLYGAAVRLSMLVSFVLVAANSVMVPRYSELIRTGDLGGLERLSKMATLVLSAVSAIIVVSFLLFGTQIMGAFGPGFSEGASILVILGIGQFINIVTGPVGYLAIVSNHEARYFRATVGSVVLLVMLLLAFGQYGGVGIAVASTIAIAVLNVTLMWGNYKLYGFFTMPFVDEICRKVCAR